MKVVVISDLHCKLSGYDQLVDGIPENVYYPLLNLENAAKKAKELDTVLIIAGDLIHEKSNLNQVILKNVIDKLQYITEDLKVETVIVTGNHDYIEFNQQLVTWLSQLRFDNLTTVLPFSTERFGEYYFVPNEPIEQLVEDVSNSDSGILVSHFGLYEGQLSGSEFKTGELTLKQLQQYKRVILGHYHKPQEVGNVIYVGSPTPVSVAEFQEDKRYIVYDDEEDKFESILTQYPKTITVTEDNVETIDLTNIEDRISSGDKFYFKLPKDHKSILDLNKLIKKYPSHIKIKKVESKDQEEQYVTLHSINYDTILSEIAKESGINISRINLFKILAKELLSHNVEQK